MLANPIKRDGGFTYVGILILVAIIGLISAATLQVGALMQRRAAEEELLAIGMEYRDALISYANATPAGQSRLPRSMQDLLKDPRYAGQRRHLRKIYTDPITGKEDWETFMLGTGLGIIGIHSRSDAVPIKVGNFDVSFESFNGKLSYRDWIFFVPLSP